MTDVDDSSGILPFGLDLDLDKGVMPHATRRNTRALLICAGITRTRLHSAS